MGLFELHYLKGETQDCLPPITFDIDTVNEYLTKDKLKSLNEHYTCLRTYLTLQYKYLKRI